MKTAKQIASDRISRDIAEFGEENITKLGCGVFAHNSGTQLSENAIKKAKIKKALGLVKLQISNGLNVNDAVISASKAYGISKHVINRSR